jgi:hypothetical protein
MAGKVSEYNCAYHEMFGVKLNKTKCVVMSGQQFGFNCIEQCPLWEASSGSASRGIPCLFLEPKGSLPYSQERAAGSTQLLSHCFVKIHFIFFHATLTSSESSVCFTFCDKNVVHISQLSHLCYTSFSVISSLVLKSVWTAVLLCGFFRSSPVELSPKYNPE